MSLFWNSRFECVFYPHWNLIRLWNFLWQRWVSIFESQLLNRIKAQSEVYDTTKKSEEPCQKKGVTYIHTTRYLAKHTYMQLMSRIDFNSTKQCRVHIFFEIFLMLQWLQLNLKRDLEYAALMATRCCEYLWPNTWNRCQFVNLRQAFSWKDL